MRGELKVLVHRGLDVSEQEKALMSLDTVGVMTQQVMVEVANERAVGELTVRQD